MRLAGALPAGRVEPLSGAAWDEARVRDAIAGIVRDAENAAFAPEALGPPTSWDAWTSPAPLTNLTWVRPASHLGLALAGAVTPRRRWSS